MAAHRAKSLLKLQNLYRSIEPVEEERNHDAEDSFRSTIRHEKARTAAPGSRKQRKLGVKASQKNKKLKADIKAARDLEQIQTITAPDEDYAEKINKLSKSAANPISFKPPAERSNSLMRQQLRRKLLVQTVADGKAN